MEQEKNKSIEELNLDGLAIVAESNRKEAENKKRWSSKAIMKCINPLAGLPGPDRNRGPAAAHVICIPK